MKSEPTKVGENFANHTSDTLKIYKHSHNSKKKNTQFDLKRDK